MGRLTRDWGALGPEQRVAGVASGALFLTMLLPWYQQNVAVGQGNNARLLSRNLNAFQVFSFIEGAVLLVALAIGYLLYARAEGREFHLPGSDGATVFVAGMWAVALLVLRLFDKPSIGGSATVGVQWGIFFALAAAGALAYAGSRMRPAHVARHGRSRRRLPGSEPAIAPAGDESQPAEGQPAAPYEAAPTPDAPREHPPHAPATAAGAAGATAAVPHADGPAAADPAEPAAPARRPRYPPAPADQMSFEDSEHSG